MPAYRRLDLSASHLTVWYGAMVVLFAGMNNAMGRTNVFRYAYSADYQQRHPIASGAVRSLYFGVSVAK